MNTPDKSKKPTVPPRRCQEKVWPRGRFYMPVGPSRCSRNAVPGSKFCKQHGGAA